MEITVPIFVCGDERPKPRLCRRCGGTFLGRPVQKRCPACQREANQEHQLRANAKLQRKRIAERAQRISPAAE